MKLPRRQFLQLAATVALPALSHIARAQTMDISLAQEIAKFQGTWKQIGYERDGVREPIDDEQNWKPRTTFIGTTFVVRIADGRANTTHGIQDQTWRSPQDHAA
jgi:hypothetical protein